MTERCGCCTGIELVTPEPLAQRPALSALAYRVGTHATFLESMRARISSAPPASALTRLRTRDADDPAIAWLDAWAVVADVLTFYQERIANEGFLRTATERRSVLELARLVGYRPRPGVSSSVHVAFTLQSGFDVLVPAGTAAKTIPGPGELPQTFETSDDLDARAVWNALLPRRTRPQRITRLNAIEIREIYFDGVATRLKPNDRLLLAFGDGAGEQVMRRVSRVDEDHDLKRTRATLQLEAFSAIGFVIALLHVLDESARTCDDLARSEAVTKLRLALGVKPPLEAASKAVVTALETLGADVGLSDAAIVELTKVADADGELAKTLVRVLGQPHAGLATSVGALVDVSVAQQQGVLAIVGALDAFDTVAHDPDTPTVTASLEAFVDAESVLALHAIPTESFTAVAREAKALDDAWRTVLRDLDDQDTATIAKTRSLIDLALALSPPPDDKDLQAQLKSLGEALDEVGGKPPLAKTEQIELAADALKGATAKLPALTKLLKEIRKALDGGVDQGTAAVAAALRSLDRHQRLRLSDAALDTLRIARRQMESLGDVVPAAALGRQRTLIAATLEALAALVASGLTLEHVHELTAALQKAPGTIVHDDIVDALDAVALPVDLEVPQAKEALARTTATLQTVRDAVSFAQAVDRADAARAALQQQTERILDAIEDAKDEQLCVDALRTALTREQQRFAEHYAPQFAALLETYQRRATDIGETEAMHTVLEALGTALASPDATASVTGLASLVTPVRKLIVSGREVPAGPAVRAWFDELLADFDRSLDAITKAAPPPEIPKVESKSSVGWLQTIGETLLQQSDVGAPAHADLETAFGETSDAVARALLVLKPALGRDLLEAWGRATVEPSTLKVFAFRVNAPLFGYNAPTGRATLITDETNAGQHQQRFSLVDTGDPVPAEKATLVDLDAAYNQVLPASWLAVQDADSGAALFARAGDVKAGIGLARYGLSGSTTEIALVSPADPQTSVGWFKDQVASFTAIRRLTVFAQAELLALAEEPILEAGDDPRPERVVEGNRILLDRYVEGLQPGRVVAVSGERVDVSGVRANELALVIGVNQALDVTLPGDTLHTELVFAVKLQNRYVRSTVTINANVAHATHGETQREVLGSGNGTQAFQRFKLAKPPLTYRSQPTASGAESTLQVRVNDILWHEANDISQLGARDRRFVVDIADDGTTMVGFGDGTHGSRLPTGVENVRGVYRSGIGKPGNVGAGRISVLASPPLGVTAVANPGAATGGADPETRDQARRNAPVAVLALDRLVAVRDYADFARAYAGIAKANASLDASTVTVAIAGIDDGPIDPRSDLFANLQTSLEAFGDPQQVVALKLRSLKVLVLQCGVFVHPDYDPAVVVARIRTALGEAFGFERQELGEPVVLSQVVSVMQQVPGVLAIDVEHFDALSEGVLETDKTSFDPRQVIAAVKALGTPAPFVPVAPGEIAYFSPALPEALVLNPIVRETRV